MKSAACIKNMPLNDNDKKLLCSIQSFISSKMIGGGGENGTIIALKNINNSFTFC